MKTEIAKDALPTEPEQGLKWRRDVAEVDLAGVPVTIVDDSGNEYQIPQGYAVTVERWRLASDHPLVLGQVYMLASKKFGKDVQTYVSPIEQTSRIGAQILYNVQKIKPINSAPAKGQKEQEIDARFDHLNAKFEKLLEKLGE